MATCSKITYTSKHDAHVAIDKIVKGHRASAHRLAAYLCNHCELWHLTHQKTKRGAKSRKQLLAELVE